MDSPESRNLISKAVKNELEVTSGIRISILRGAVCMMSQHECKVLFICAFPASRTRMVRCVAYSCSGMHSDGVSLHKFPKDPTLRCQWVKQVQRTRADWKGPIEYIASVLCSKHFTPDCLEANSALFE